MYLLLEKLEVERPSYVFNHSSTNTTNINPTTGSEFSPWWQSWTCSTIWWSCLHMTTMAICNPILLSTKNLCTYNVRLLVFKTNNQVPVLIWYPLIWKWNKSNYSIGWNNFVILIKNLPINQFPYCIRNMLNLKQHPQLFNKLHTNKTHGQLYQFLVKVKDHKFPTID